MVLNSVLFAACFAAFYISATFPLPLKNATSILDGRIVGGIEASILQIPYQASLQLNGRHMCGAMLIRPQLLLTAAHCVEPFPADEFTVRIGSSEPYRKGLLIPVMRIISHEEFNIPTALNNDIAVIVLTRSVAFNQFMRPIPLSTSASDISPETDLFVSGWGATSAGVQAVAPILRYTAVREINHDACMSTYKSYTPITPTMLCAGLERGGRDSCQGDSGGPLVSYNSGTMKLVGIVSWGVGCAHPSYPGVYTRVDKYVKWIENMTSELEVKIKNNKNCWI